ncbi:MAG: hypothetical protein K2X41_11175 [Hyphomicrobium sp.]|nr:hypothetical protein [Hyphomicrobium sp.]
MLLLVMHLGLVASCAAIIGMLILSERTERSDKLASKPRPGTKSDTPRFFSVLPASTLKLGSVT